LYSNLTLCFTIPLLGFAPGSDWGTYVPQTQLFGLLGKNSGSAHEEAQFRWGGSHMSRGGACSLPRNF